MGRIWYSQRPLLEESPAITMATLRLSRTHFLAGERIICRTTPGNHLLQITPLNEAQNRIHAINFTYRWKGEEVSKIINIEYQACHFGGYRPYFVCPFTEKQVLSLFIGLDGTLASRHHFNLAYSLPRTHRTIYENWAKADNQKRRAIIYREGGHPRKAQSLASREEFYRTRGYVDFRRHVEQMDKMIQHYDAQMAPFYSHSSSDQ